MRTIASGQPRATVPRRTSPLKKKKRATLGRGALGGPWYRTQLDTALHQKTDLVQCWSADASPVDTATSRVLVRCHSVVRSPVERRVTTGTNSIIQCRDTVSPWAARAVQQPTPPGVFGFVLFFAIPLDCAPPPPSVQNASQPF